MSDFIVPVDERIAIWTEQLKTHGYDPSTDAELKSDIFLQSLSDWLEDAAIAAWAERLRYVKELEREGIILPAIEAYALLAGLLPSEFRWLQKQYDAIDDDTGGMPDDK